MTQIRQKTGRELNPLWNNLTEEMKRDYENYFFDGFKDVGALMQESNAAITSSVFFKRDHTGEQIDLDKTVVSITTDNINGEKYRHLAGFLLTGIESGFIHLTDALVRYFRDQNRYYYAGKIIGIRDAAINMAKDVAGIEVAMSDISTFRYSRNDERWIFNAQLPPASKDGFTNLPANWQKEIAVTYASDQGHEPKNFSFRDYEWKLSYDEDIKQWDFAKGLMDAGGGPLPFLDVDTVTIIREADKSFLRKDGYQFIGDLKDYERRIRGLVTTLVNDVLPELHMENDIEVFFSTDDFNNNQFEAEKSAVALITNRQHHDRIYPDQDAPISRIDEGVVVVGMEKGLLWIIDTLLDEIADHPSKYAKTTRYKLLALRTNLRGIVKDVFNFPAYDYKSSGVELPVNNAFTFSIYHGGDAWEFMLTRVEGPETSPTILDKEDKINLIVAAAKSFGVDVEKKPVVKYDDGEIVTLTVPDISGGVRKEHFIVTGNAYQQTIARESEEVYGLNPPPEPEDFNTVVKEVMGGDLGDTIRDILNNTYRKRAILIAFDGKPLTYLTATGDSIARDAKREMTKTYSFEEMIKNTPPIRLVDHDALIPTDDTDAKRIREVMDHMLKNLKKRISKLIMGDFNIEIESHPNLPGAPKVETVKKLDLILDVPHQLISMNGFQEQILVTANENMEWKDQVVNAALGLGGETGEVIEEIVTAITALHGSTAKIQDLLKKYFFHNWSDNYHANPSAYDVIRAKIINELGDNLFYNAWLARLFGATLGEVAQSVRLKLVGRHETPKGSPDVNDTTESQV